MRLLRVMTAIASALVVLSSSTPSPAERVVEHLFDAKLLDAQNGWVVGAFGVIYRTKDGGATWAGQKTGTENDLFSIDFTSPTRGVAVGKSGMILTTEDGGETWVKRDATIDRNLFAVTYASPEHLWAVGDWGAAVESTDGGKTWKDRTLPEDVVLTAISFADEQHGALVGEFGTVRLTDDGGASWRPSDVGTDKTLFGVAFRTPQDGWVVGMDGLILRTTNGGETWDLQRGQKASQTLAELGMLEAIRNPGLYDISFSGDYGYVVGDIGMMLVSEDRGETWKERKLPEDMALFWLRGVSAAPGDHAVVAGANGLTARFDGDRVQLHRGDS